MEKCIQRTGGCIQKATKQTNKTANIQLNYNKQLAARSCCATTTPIKSHNRQRRLIEEAKCGDNCANNKQQDVWRSLTNNNFAKINTQRLTKLLILITMSVTVLMLQQPHATEAAAIRDDDVRDIFFGLSDEQHTLESLERHRLKHYSQKREHTLQDRRLRKRQVDSYIEDHAQESSTDLEWLNPCNGDFQSESSQELLSTEKSREYFRGMGERSRTEFIQLNSKLKEIDINDSINWTLLEQKYKFLPRLRKRVPKNLLRRLYHDVQVYIGAFGYLGRKQYDWDRTKTGTASKVTRELSALLTSARSILCDIETAINNTYERPYNERFMKIMSRDKMNATLNFKTTREKPSTADLVLTKDHYFQYLQRMSVILKSPTDVQSSSSSYSLESQQWNTNEEDVSHQHRNRIPSSSVKRPNRNQPRKHRISSMSSGEGHKRL